jgi:hypothetical protein
VAEFLEVFFTQPGPGAGRDLEPVNGDDIDGAAIASLGPESKLTDRQLLEPGLAVRVCGGGMMLGGGASVVLDPDLDMDGGARNGPLVITAALA